MTSIVCVPQALTPEDKKGGRSDGKTACNSNSTYVVLNVSRKPRYGAKKNPVQAIRCNICNRLFANDGKSFSDHLPCGGAS